MHCVSFTTLAIAEHPPVQHPTQPTVRCPTAAAAVRPFENYMTCMKNYGKGSPAINPPNIITEMQLKRADGVIWKVRSAGKPELRGGGGQSAVAAPDEGNSVRSVRLVGKLVSVSPVSRRTIINLDALPPPSSSTATTLSGAPALTFTHSHRVRECNAARTCVIHMNGIVSRSVGATLRKWLHGRLDT